MKNRKFWVFLMAASLLLATLAGCGNHAASDTGSSQPGQTTASTIDTTAVPDTTEATGSTEASRATETSENEAPLDTDWIVKEWTTLCRYDKDGFSSLILLDLMLYDDGMGITVTSEQAAWETETGYVADEVNVSGKHDEVKGFSYTFDGEYLTITSLDYDLNYCENYTVASYENDTVFVLSSTDGQGALDGMMFLPINTKQYYALEELTVLYAVDCGLFQPDNPQRPDSTEAPTEQAPEGNTSSDTGWIAGDWSAVYRNEETVDGKIQTIFVSMVTYSFGADGSGSISDEGWIGRPGEEWKLAGKGYVESYFDYTLEGNTLTIIYTGDEFGEYPEEHRHAIVYNVVRNQDGSMSWEPDGGGRNVVYRKVSEDLSVDELLSIFGLESTEAPTEQAPEGNTSSDTDWILGGWTTVNRDDGFSEGKLESSFVTSVTYSFGADGSGSINERGWVGCPGGAWEVAGMGFFESYFDYTLEGNTLTIIPTGDEFEDYAEEHRHAIVYNVVRNQDGSMTWEPDGGGKDVVYRKIDWDGSVDELLSIFGLEEGGSQP